MIFALYLSLIIKLLLSIEEAAVNNHFSEIVPEKNWPITLCYLISNNNDFVSNCSWLLYYLGETFEVEFVSVAIELYYPILSHKIDQISAVVMWQESNVTTNNQRIIARHLSDFLVST